VIAFFGPARHKHDLVGRVFGTLTVIRRVPVGYRSSRHAWWETRCECGETCVQSSCALLHKAKPVRQCSACRARNAFCVDGRYARRPQ
jgi:hypothetical protein